LHDNLALLGFDTDISQDEFELVFKHFDKNNNGMIEKAEMVNFIKLIIGAQDDDEEEGDDDQMEDLEDNIDEDHQDPMDSDEQYEDQMEDFPQNQQEALNTHNTFTKQESKKQIGYGAV
jgi:Ca2+-binding EF-hand superfamily protein